MEAFRRNQTQFRSMLEGAFTGGPFEELHKRNMAMFEAAAGIFAPGTKPQTGAPAADQSNAKDDEIAALKAQLASLQAKVDKLG